MQSAGLWLIRHGPWALLAVLAASVLLTPRRRNAAKRVRPRSSVVHAVSCTVIVSVPVRHLRASERNRPTFARLVRPCIFAVACTDPDYDDAERLGDVAGVVSFLARLRISLIRMGWYPVRSTHTFMYGPAWVSSSWWLWPCTFTIPAGTWCTGRCVSSRVGFPGLIIVTYDSSSPRSGTPPLGSVVV